MVNELIAFKGRCLGKICTVSLVVIEICHFDFSGLCVGMDLLALDLENNVFGKRCLF